MHLPLSRRQPRVREAGTVISACRRDVTNWRVVFPVDSRNAASIPPASSTPTVAGPSVPSTVTERCVSKKCVVIVREQQAVARGIGQNSEHQASYVGGVHGRRRRKPDADPRRGRRSTCIDATMATTQSQRGNRGAPLSGHHARESGTGSWQPGWRVPSCSCSSYLVPWRARLGYTQ